MSDELREKLQKAIDECLYERQAQTPTLRTYILAAIMPVVEELEEHLDAITAVIEQMAEALEQSHHLSTVSVMALEDSESHHHGSRAAAKYAEKELQILEQIRTAIAAYTASRKNQRSSDRE